MARRAVRRTAAALAAALLMAAAGLGVGASDASADVCASRTSRSTTATICIVMLKAGSGTPVSPTAGRRITLSGKTRVAATIHYTPATVPGGERRGCGGERLTPSGCMTFLVNGSYTLTRLYFNRSTIVQNTRASRYAWIWHTAQYRNGDRTLTAQLTVNGGSLQVSVPVRLSNRTLVTVSPIPNRGKVAQVRRRASRSGFVVAALGDGPPGSRQAVAVAGMVHAWKPGMLLYLGDVYQRGMKEEFLNFYDPLYHGDWPRTAPTIGNHEYKQLPDGRGYFWYWNYPKGSPRVAGGGGGWYTLRAGGWRIFSLNSNVSMDRASPQGKWLAAELQRDERNRPLSRRPCTLAFWHAARFSDISLRMPSTTQLWGQLYPYHADVIVNAHSHAYERWSNMSMSAAKAGFSPSGYAKGITEFVAGTGGNVLAQVWQTADPDSDFRQRTSWGALKLVLYQHSLRFAYWSVAPGSNRTTLLDSGKLRCH